MNTHGNFWGKILFSDIGYYLCYMTLTEQGTKIKLRFQDLTCRRVRDVQHCYMVLHPDHIQYEVVADYTVEDEDLGMWVEKNSDYRYCRLRSSLVDVSMFRDNKENMWCVQVAFSGIDEGGCCWYWEDKAEATSVYEQLVDYMLGRI